MSHSTHRSPKPWTLLADAGHACGACAKRPTTLEYYAPGTVLPTSDGSHQSVHMLREKLYCHSTWDSCDAWQARKQEPGEYEQVVTFQDPASFSQPSSRTTSTSASSDDAALAMPGRWPYDVVPGVCSPTQGPYFDSSLNGVEHHDWLLYSWTNPACPEPPVPKTYSTETSPTSITCLWEDDTEIKACGDHLRTPPSAECSNTMNHEQRKARRRAQNREAQRTYRKRQASILASAQQQIEDLQRALAESRRSSSGYGAKIPEMSDPNLIL
jgi:hypothetical protein